MNTTLRVCVCSIIKISTSLKLALRSPQKIFKISHLAHASENGLTNTKKKILDQPISKKQFLIVCTKECYYKSLSLQYY